MDTRKVVVVLLILAIVFSGITIFLSVSNLGFIQGGFGAQSAGSAQGGSAGVGVTILPPGGG